MDQKPRIEITSTKLITSWMYNTVCHECAYCKHSLLQSSPDFYAEGNISTISTGKCGHSFHHECINAWLKKSHTCPVCRQKWVDT